MSGQSFRFLHAASFQLHQPLTGLTDVSPELVELLTEAPYSSAAAVFSAAVREEVDFVVLSGDLFDPTSAGPRSITFLQDQFAKLAERNIAIYWSASQLDLTGDWLRSIEWPDNVHLFSSDSVERMVHCRGEIPLAELIGRSWHGQRPMRASEFQGQTKEYPRVAVLAGQLDWQNQREAAHYWACGGSLTAVTPLDGPSVAHCPGSPQGRTHAQSGPHGCTLVYIGADRSVRTRMVATDAVRWCHERVQASQGMSRYEARQALKARIKHLTAEIGKPLLVVWTITGDARFESLFVQAADREVMLKWLREEYAEATPPLWSVSLELDPPDALPTQWIEEDSILGDYLRVAQKYLSEPDLDLGLQPNVQGNPPAALLEALSLSQPQDREQVLREAALLGEDLLRRDESFDH